MENNEFDTIENDKQDRQNPEPLPGLYSEETIMGFAFFCSTVFASFLVVENLKQANARKGIVPVIAFTIIYMALEGFILMPLPAKYRILGFVFNFAGGVILNLFFSRKYIPGNLVFETKSIRKPLFIAIILTLVSMLLIGSGGVVPK